MQVRCLVGEVDIKRVQVGQQAAVRLDAFPGPVFRGQVAQLAPMATPQPDAPDVQVFEVMIGFHDQDERLRPGMSAQVEIVLENLPEVLSVPLAAVFEQGDTAVVYCLRQGAFARVPVELGRRSATTAEVHAGLREGDVVALKEPSRR
jgi:multidrug efflux pump subunit AcrA (membrane-fusion protein)